MSAGKDEGFVKKYKNPKNLSGAYSTYANSLIEGKFARFQMVAEAEIAELLEEGNTSREIADELGLLLEDVYRVVRRIKKKKRNSG